MNKLTKTLLGLCIIILLTCSTVSADWNNPGPEPGKGYTTTNVVRGELTEKSYVNGHYYVTIYNEDTDSSGSSLYISKKKYNRAVIGEDYEWKRINYPDGRESISFHRI